VEWNSAESHGASPEAERGAGVTEIDGAGAEREVREREAGDITAPLHPLSLQAIHLCRLLRDSFSRSLCHCHTYCNTDI